MTFQTVLCFLAVFFLTKGAPPNGRIVNGTDAKDGEFPYAVSIRYRNNHECGGSIIGKNWVLTAAHCVFTDFLNVSTVLYGTVNVQNGMAPDGYIKKVKRAIVNEDYISYVDYAVNDVALIEVEEPFEFTDKVSAVPLPPYLGSVPRNTDSILIGWGYSVTNGTVMPTLQKADLVVFSDEKCENQFPAWYDPNFHICAGVENGGKGQCSGDSGGPLTIGGVQHGIVSWSDKPCALTPGVLTKITNYREWISINSGI